MNLKSVNTGLIRFYFQIWHANVLSLVACCLKAQLFLFLYAGEDAWRSGREGIGGRGNGSEKREEGTAAPADSSILHCMLSCKDQLDYTCACIPGVMYQSSSLFRFFPLHLLFHGLGILLEN